MEYLLEPKVKEGWVETGTEFLGQDEPAGNSMPTPLSHLPPILYEYSPI